MLNCFNSSRMGLELVLYMKMAKIGPILENEQFRLYFFVLPTSPLETCVSLCPQVSRLYLLQTLLVM
jgi:hypothetical protein